MPQVDYAALAEQARRQTSGLLQAGNIDLSNRPRVKNPDGSVSTVRSLGVNIDGREVLIPTVVGGKVVSDDEAIANYKRTGQHLGMFDTPEHATTFAQQLHENEAQKLKAPASVDYAALAAQARQGPATPDDRRRPAMNFAIVNGQRVPVADPDDFTDQPAQLEGSAVGRFFSNVGEKLNPAPLVRTAVKAMASPEAMGRTVEGLYEGAVDAAAQQFGKAREAYEQGRYSEAVGHGLAGALPVIGPTAADVGEQIGRGDVAGGLGGATGLLAPFAAGKVVSAARGVLPARAAAAVNPTVEFARARGIPLDAATVSDNFAVKGAQALADRSLGGAAIGTKARATQAAAMERVGGELADTAHPVTVTPEQAGAGLRQTLLDKVKTHNVDATTAYDTLRAIEQKTPIPVTLTAQKAALRPLYDSLKRSAELVPLQGDKGRALVALDRLMSGPNVAALSDVDAALGDLKAMARADIPELRTAGQGTAAQAVKQLDTAVRGAAMRAGPKAYDALTKGRAATVAKYETADVLDLLNDEPVRTVKALTAPKDSAIGRLRAVTKEAPGQTPELARAYLEDLLQAPQKVADWRKLGPETKATLFPAKGQVEALDRFFDLTDRISKTNVNPSGSGYVAMLGAQGAMLWTNPLTAIPVQLTGATMAKLMRSPAAIDALTTGLRLPASAPKVARTLATNRLLKAAAKVGVNLHEPVPALAAGGDKPESQR